MSEIARPTIPVAYIAGVIDARAHIELTNRHGNPAPRVRITTKQVELLEWLAALTGTKVVRDDRGYERRPCGEHCREQHTHVVRQSSQWTVDSTRATVLLYNIAPHIVVRREVILRALAAGLDRWPAQRGNTAAQMYALGWELPTTDEADA